MAYKGLRECIDTIEQRGQLKRISALVDPELEITEITDRISKAGGPALLFENVKGSHMPVLINAYGSLERMAWSLQVEDLDNIAAEITGLLQLADDMPESLLGKDKMLPQLAQLSNFFPRLVKSGPCQDVVMIEPDLDKLPILKMGIDATKKWPTEGHLQEWPADINMSREIIEMVNGRWSEYGLD